jgi:hypothetical protein
MQTFLPISITVKGKITSPGNSDMDNIIEWGYQQRIELWNGIAKRIQQKRTELN